MRKTNLLLIVVMSILISSCSVLKTNSIKTMDIYDTGVIQNPVLVDLDVKETKVTGTAKGDKDDLKLIMADAVFNALETSKADVLIEPKYKTETYRGVTTVTVTGYPAYYVNFRPLTRDDVELFERAREQDPLVTKALIKRE